MAELKLTNTPATATVSDCDIERILAYSKSWRLKFSNAVWYVVTSKREGNKVRTIRLHRFIMNCPVGMTVEHKDGDALNNDRENLECMSYASNTKRMHSRIKG